MRPWLLLPVVFPGMWFGATWYGLWPVGWEMAEDPIFGGVAAMVGLAAVWVLDRAAGRGRPVRVPDSLLPPLKKKEIPPPLEPTDLVSWALTPRSLSRLTPWPGLKVEMPRRATATPAPRA